MKSFEDCTTYVFPFRPSNLQLSQCLLREEVRSGYLTKEKNILCNVLNENKGVKHRKECAPEQYVLNKQLEVSQLARELSQFYHEMNRFHYCSLTINNTIPFRFTLPSRHKPKSTIQFYTSTEPITKETIELYNSILLFYPPHFYTQAAKESESSFLAKFVALASPFLSFEAMSVELDVPIEKIFEVALNLQEANMATIIICITHRTCFTVAPNLPTEHLSARNNEFKARFGELGSLLHILAIFSNAPSLKAVFPHFKLAYTPYTSASAEELQIYNAILYLMQKRFIVPVAVHCQYREFPPSSKLHKTRDEEDTHDEDEYTNTHYKYCVSSQTLSSVSTAPSYADSQLIRGENPDFLSIPKSLRNTTYYPLLFRCHESFLEIPESLSAATISAEGMGDRSREHLARLIKEGSPNPGLGIYKPLGETKVVYHKELLEKCKPLMKDHYCVEEICYKLAIPECTFWDMVREDPKHFYVYYVVSNL
ncbi:uncharacterized protein [Blastocystis hominis]|uniref:Uncharacterized protein n=1 Tax=Blastocystis hominis TaxID=12968 RepID=D8M5W4_BLAHO|nr:uncharacterized protein [Blastocystis hominis]CBK23563.2 unnamed protein product [Blastocystis hominis]|eukprot:XP_012897611.1 uncharacterized protein [Blastocystis hominis]